MMECLIDDVIEYFINDVIEINFWESTTNFLYDTISIMKGTKFYFNIKISFVVYSNPDPKSMVHYNPINMHYTQDKYTHQCIVFIAFTYHIPNHNLYIKIFFTYILLSPIKN